MTNKEATIYLEWLSNIDFSKKHPTYTMVTNPEQVEALKLAITALQVQDRLQDFEYMSRLSGGADYFRAFAAFLEKTNNSNEQLNNLNATQFNGIESKVKGMTACRVPEDDYISRQDALEMFESTTWYDPRDIDVAHEIIGMLPSAQPDNQINLCDSCNYSYPDCPSKNDDVIFGNGIGNDNICACNKYKPSVQPEIIMCKDCKHLQKCRSEESAKKFGQIYECARNVLDCPKPEDFCSWGERRNDGTEQPCG